MICEDTMIWCKRPLIYEIPTWVWLDELRARYSQPLTLATIPAHEWDALAELAIDAVWLMGVWERSPAGIAVASASPELQAEFRKVLADYRPEESRLRLLCAGLRRCRASRRTGRIGAGVR